MWPSHPITWAQDPSQQVFTNHDLLTNHMRNDVAKEQPLDKDKEDWMFRRPLTTPPNTLRNEVKIQHYQESTSSTLVPFTKHPAGLPSSGDRKRIEDSLTGFQNKRIPEEFRDTPIDLTINKPFSAVRNTSSNIEDGRVSLATSKWRQAGRIGDVSKELKRLQRTVALGECSTQDVKVDGQLMEWLPASLSVKGDYQTANRNVIDLSSPEVDVGVTGNGNNDRKDQPAANKMRTPPTSDSLTSSMLPVARRLDTGFDMSIDRKYVNRDEDGDRFNSSVSELCPPSLFAKIKHFAVAESFPERSPHGIKPVEMEVGGMRTTRPSPCKVDDKTSKKKTITTKFECPCGVFYAHRDTYDVHMAFHYSQSEPFRCRVCDRNYNGAVEFYYHVIRYPHDVTA